MDAPSGCQCKKRRVLTDTKGGRTMEVTRIGLDIAKTVFQVHGVDAQGKVSVQKRLSRSKVLPYFAQLPPVSDWEGSVRQCALLGAGATEAGA